MSNGMTELLIVGGVCFVVGVGAAIAVGYLLVRKNLKGWSGWL